MNNIPTTETANQSYFDKHPIVTCLGLITLSTGIVCIAVTVHDLITTKTPFKLLTAIHNDTAILSLQNVNIA